MKSCRASHSTESADALIAAIAHVKLKASEFKDDVSRLKQRSIDFQIKIVYSSNCGDINPEWRPIHVTIKEACPVYELFRIRGSLKCDHQMCP